MPYIFDYLDARDPSNPAVRASNASITIHAVGDATKAPLTITTTAGDPLANPITTSADGYGPAFMHATLDRVAWSGGDLTGFMTAYEGIKNEAVAARTAADNAAALVNAPADSAVEALVKGPTTLTRVALDADYAPKSHVHSAATSTAAGFMPAADKATLDAASVKPTLTPWSSAAPMAP